MKNENNNEQNIYIYENALNKLFTIGKIMKGSEFRTISIYNKLDIPIYLRKNIDFIINDFVIPNNQIVTGSSASLDDVDNEQLLESLRETKKNIGGIAHGHGNHRVFHSAIDDNTINNHVIHEFYNTKVSSFIFDKFTSDNYGCYLSRSSENQDCIVDARNLNYNEKEQLENILNKINIKIPYKTTNFTTSLVVNRTGEDVFALTRKEDNYKLLTKDKNKNKNLDSNLKSKYSELCEVKTIESKNKDIDKELLSKELEDKIIFTNPSDKNKIFPEKKYTFFTNENLHPKQYIPLKGLSGITFDNCVKLNNNENTNTIKENTNNNEIYSRYVNNFSMNDIDDESTFTDFSKLRNSFYEIYKNNKIKNPQKRLNENDRNNIREIERKRNNIQEKEYAILKSEYTKMLWELENEYYDPMKKKYFIIKAQELSSRIKPYDDNRRRVIDNIIYDLKNDKQVA